MPTLNRFKVKPARLRKMRCFVILDTEKKEIVQRFDNDLKRNVKHFWGEIEANDFADYLANVII